MHRIWWLVSCFFWGWDLLQYTNHIRHYMTKNIGMVLVDLRHVYIRQMFCSDTVTWLTFDSGIFDVPWCTQIMFTNTVRNCHYFHTMAFVFTISDSGHCFLVRNETFVTFSNKKRGTRHPICWCEFSSHGGRFVKRQDPWLHREVSEWTKWTPQYGWRSINDISFEPPWNMKVLGPKYMGS